MTNDRYISSKSESNFYASRKSLFQWYKLYPSANEAIVDHRALESSGKDIAFRVLDNTSSFMLGDCDYVGLVHYSNCCKIISKESFNNLVVNCGFVKTLDEYWLLVDVMPEGEWDRLYFLALDPIEIRDYHKTFILRWNTDISGLKLNDFHEKIDEIRTFNYTYSWRVSQPEKIHIGDRYYMVRTGKGGQEGIVMRGYFKSLPEVGDGPDHNGQFLVNMVVENVIDPATAPKLISVSDLRSLVPEFNWKEGHTGDMLSTEQACAVNKLWDEYEWDLFHEGQEEIVPDNFNEIFAGKDWHSIVNH